MTQEDKNKLNQNEVYEVKIDSTLHDGSLTYADLIIPGESEKEILISTYICHPSLANNELSGPVVAAFLAKHLIQQKNYFTYRFVFIPETIGSIVYLSRNKEILKKNVIAGYVVTCVGDAKEFSYLQTRWENTLTDQLTKHLLKRRDEPYHLYSFLDRGSDERQYCSPGINLPIGSLMRSKYGVYPEYHTSLDNLDLISAEGLKGSLDLYKECLLALDNNHIFETTTCCEPQLGKRGLYPSISNGIFPKDLLRLRNLLAYADGTQDLLSIAEQLDCSILELIPIAKVLESHQLLKRVNHES